MMQSTFSLRSPNMQISPPFPACLPFTLSLYIIHSKYLIATPLWLSARSKPFSGIIGSVSLSFRNLDRKMLKNFLYFNTNKKYAYFMHDDAIVVEIFITSIPFGVSASLVISRKILRSLSKANIKISVSCEQYSSSFSSENYFFNP